MSSDLHPKVRAVEKFIQDPTLAFHGGAGTVTGSKYLTDIYLRHPEDHDIVHGESPAAQGLMGEMRKK